MESTATQSEFGKGRKKLINKKNWKRTQEKENRHKPKTLPKHPKCNHKKQTFGCDALSMQNIRKFHEAFYQNKTKIDQDKFILKHTTQSVPKRRRKITGTRQGNAVSINYFVKTKTTSVPVCSKAFLSILGISKFRVQNISRNYIFTGQSPVEKRGGDRKSTKFELKKNKVKMFIMNLKCVESHYSRNKSDLRQYMPSDCSIRKLWRSYCNENEALKVKYDFFRQIFVKDFNISFKSPATDACSMCISFKGLISATDSEATKLELIQKLRVHKLRAKFFYNSLKYAEENTLKISFDCQKNMVLPRVPDQAAYYSRQLYLHNFTICEGHSTGLQPKESVTSYTWTENQSLKGSNEISSMVYDKLSSLDLNNVKCIKMFCDGCPGQNKNVTLMGMLMHWLNFTECSVETITITFPVVGHSFLPPDRVFGRIEKIVRRQETIIKPEEYRHIFSEYSTVKVLGKDFSIFDWKSVISSVVKPPSQWHFKFSAAKRITLKKMYNRSSKTVVVKGDAGYRIDIGVFKSVLKKGKVLQNFLPKMLIPKVSVATAKLKDVDALLKKHFGSDWRVLNRIELDFYNTVIENVSKNVCSSDKNEENEDILVQEETEIL